MQALLLEQQDGKTLASVQTLDESRLPEGDVTVDVHWSSLNYKDALAITGKGKIIRNFPMIPGIDFAGTVRTSEDPRFHAGQEVLLTGWGVGENHWGGLAEQARVKGDWLVAMPQGLDARKAMIIGTAGFTAMLCVMALEDAGVRPQDGEIVVTGASGGVGTQELCIRMADTPEMYRCVQAFIERHGGRVERSDTIRKDDVLEMKMTIRCQEPITQEESMALMAENKDILRISV